MALEQHVEKSSAELQVTGLLRPLEEPDISRNHFTPSRPKDNRVDHQHREEPELQEKPSAKSFGPQQLRGGARPARGCECECLWCKPLETPRWRESCAQASPPEPHRMQRTSPAPCPQPGSQLRVMTDPSSQALLGTKARLQCHFDVGGPVALRSLRVTWKLWDESITQYEGGRSWGQAEASMNEMELEKGDASLTLPRVTLADEGLYTCAVGYGAQQQQGSTSLRVLAPPTISLTQCVALASAVTSLLCHMGGFYPEATGPSASP
ncbi:hypothetical protein Y1Q_0020754 [Alligator mississippiensis]|uniref:Ig-like domain-containing protein n=1 Tax=Alligator mississippiensis TaxID=8496 RepID=A0A151P4V2_ALLMI|nr:hypothetical protein Y1Q_0020754 [Alligator mississippiensis]